MKINNILIENFLSMENVSIDFEQFSELVLVDGIWKDDKKDYWEKFNKSSHERKV